MSENGRIHFEEVKEIFVAVQYICIFTFILGLAGILWQRRYQNHLYLGLTAILTIAIPSSTSSPIDFPKISVSQMASPDASEVWRI